MANFKTSNGLIFNACAAKIMRDDEACKDFLIDHRTVKIMQLNKQTRKYVMWKENHARQVLGVHLRLMLKHFYIKFCSECQGLLNESIDDAKKKKTTTTNLLQKTLSITEQI